MSKKDKKNDSGSGKKSSIVVLLLLLLVVAACGVAGFTFYELNKMKKDGVAKNEAVAEPAEAPTPTYIPLDTFTVSLKPNDNGDDNASVLYIGLTLSVKDDKSKALIEKFLPEIRSRLLILFSQQTAGYLATDEGKRQLIKQIKTVVSQPLVDNYSASITDVLYNAFILR